MNQSPAHYVIFFLYNLTFGGLDAFWIDRYARRFLMPLFYTSQIFINFYPNHGKGKITDSDFAGANTALFWINTALLSGYVAIFLSAYASGILFDEGMASLETRQEKQKDDARRYELLAVTLADIIGVRPYPTAQYKLKRAFGKIREIVFLRRKKSQDDERLAPITTAFRRMSAHTPRGSADGSRRTISDDDDFCTNFLCQRSELPRANSNAPQTLQRAVPVPTTRTVPTSWSEPPYLASPKDIKVGLRL